MTTTNAHDKRQPVTSATPDDIFVFTTTDTLDGGEATVTVVGTQARREQDKFWTSLGINYTVTGS